MLQEWPGGIVSTAKADPEWYLVAASREDRTWLIAVEKASGRLASQETASLEFSLTAGQALFVHPSGEPAIWNLRDESVRTLRIGSYQPAGFTGTTALLRNGTSEFLVGDVETDVWTKLRIPPGALGRRQDVAGAAILEGAVRIVLYEEWDFEKDGGRVYAARNRVVDAYAPFLESIEAELKPGAAIVVPLINDTIALAGDAPAIFRGSDVLHLPQFRQQEQAVAIGPDRPVAKFVRSEPEGRLALIGIQQPGDQLDVLYWDSLNACYQRVTNNTTPYETGFALSEDGTVASLAISAEATELVLRVRSGSD